MPRLLALYDSNPVSPTLGLGDRYYWGWKLIDFGNATFQGATHGLSRLIANNLLPPEMDSSVITKLIVRMCLAVRYLQDKNGSVCEAFPHESSFCVTALVAYDLLSTLECLGDKLSGSEKAEIMQVVKPMITFLHRNDEHHGLISNHLATASAALFKFHAISNEGSHADRGQFFLNRILSHQSTEGWYREYEGADPGYQSLCTYYLADIHKLRPDLGLRDSLERSIKFLSYFAHPDGSFGGLYGSRNTRFFYPSGLEMLREEIPEAGRLADFMRDSIRSSTVVTLETMDEPNLVPMFNSYCLASKYFQPSDGHYTNMPCLNKSLGKLYFPKAGIYIQGDMTSYTIISTKKGGVCYSFPREGKKGALINAGIVYQSDKQDFYTSQAINENNEVIISDQKIKIFSPLTRVINIKLTPFKFMMLRFLNVTVMRNKKISNLVKQFLVWMLINRKSKINIRNERTISFSNGLVVRDKLSRQPNGWKKIDIKGEFSTMHMASQGYWQMQDGRK